MAECLAAVGASPGERVALLLPNRAEVLDLFFGIARLGAVQVPLNPYLRGEFLAHQPSDAAPGVVVTDQAGWATLQPVLTRVPDLRSVVLLDAGAKLPRHEGVAMFDYHDLPRTTFDDPEITASSLMSILYTSGTTGQAKGCMLTHGYYTRCGQLDAAMLRLTGDDVFLSCLPLFHGGAQLKGIMPCLMAGTPFVVEERFSASGFFRGIAEAGATVANAVGAMGAMVLASPPSQWDRNHRLRILNVAPLAETLQQSFMDRFGTDAWTEVYGQTECVPVLIGDPHREDRDRSTLGTPAPDLEVALLDDDLQEVAAGDVGEICLRPRHRFVMFSGYWRRPEDTLAAQEGLWHHTGDYGLRLPSGEYRFVDRKKDALRVRGENVSSVELETAITGHPDIVEAAVHAVESELTEDDIKACLIVGAPVHPAALFAWFREALPYFAIPRYVEVLEELPRNAVNRVLKHILRDRGVTESTWDLQAMGLAVSRDERR